MSHKDKEMWEHIADSHEDKHEPAPSLRRNDKPHYCRGAVGEIRLACPAWPSAEYIRTKQIGLLLFVSGQGPIRDGRPVYVRQVGPEVTREQAYNAARIAALNTLAAIKALIGKLDHIEAIAQW